MNQNARGAGQMSNNAAQHIDDLVHSTNNNDEVADDQNTDDQEISSESSETTGLAEVSPPAHQVVGFVKNIDSRRDHVHAWKFASIDESKSSTSTRTGPRDKTIKPPPDTSLAVGLNIPLKMLYAQHMFAVFFLVAC
jgi:hypothetical protein